MFRAYAVPKRFELIDLDYRAHMAHSILLVEDNEDNRIIYATALRYAGYQVFEAITGTDGVQQARTQRPDLVLMDISVPELDGWEATAILKADPITRHIPVIAVTAHALPGDEERSREAGCDGYLAKPIPPAALIAEVDRRFGRTTPSYTPRTSGEATLRL
jgi:CheY-like chemotaxis protein